MTFVAQPTRRSRTFQHLAALLVAALLSIPSPSLRADPGPEVLTIATWNLEWFYDAYPGDNFSDLSKEQSSQSQERWEAIRSGVADAIAKMQPTILAVQEVENRKVLLELTKELKDRHRMGYRVAFIEGFDSATEQDVAFLYRSGLVEFSRREQTKEQFDSQDFYNLSKHLFGKFQWQVDGRTETFTLLNVHFRAKPEESAIRLRQSRLARTWLQPHLDQGEHVIFLGDTNIEEPCCEPQPGGEMAMLTGKGTEPQSDDLVDSHQKVPPEKRRTHLVLDKQYDRILLSQSLVQDLPDRRNWVWESTEVRGDVVVRGAGPDEDHWNQRTTIAVEELDLSDHYPVMVTLRLK